MKLVSIGEVLWDVFPDGEFIGGAPFNLAAHAARLGNDSYLFSAVGTDAKGARARNEMERLGVRQHLVATAGEHPTGIVKIVRDASGEPTYTIIRPAAYDAATLTADARAALASISPNWLSFGTLFAFGGQGLQTVKQVLEVSTGRRFYDVNLRDGHYRWATVETLLNVADVVKLNRAELSWISRQCSLRGLPNQALCEALCEEFLLQGVWVTLGEAGCTVLHQDEYHEEPGAPAEVASTVGAGDSFGAMVIHGLAQGWPLPTIARRANLLGAYVASQPGAVPDYDPARFLDA